MKKIVPFTKDLMFKTKIGEITSISLDHTLKLDKQVVSGEFILEGSYKMLEGGELEEKFSFNIPVDITIDDKYETKNCVISIDDFTYEIINEEALKVNISVMLDDLDIREDPPEKIEIEVDDISNREIDFELLEDKLLSDKDINNVDKQIDKNMDLKDKSVNEMDDKLEISNKKESKELFQDIDSTKEYSIYRVYTVKEDDTIDLILEKYQISRELLSDYNDLDNIMVGSKLIIPSSDE